MTFRLLLLAGLTAAAASPVPAAAQVPPSELEYGREATGLYRERQVAAIAVETETLRRGRVEEDRRLLRYELLDRQGRVRRAESTTEQGHALRREFTYDSAGQVLTTFDYQRADHPATPLADTSHRTLRWLPLLLIRYRAQGTEPAGHTYWDRATGLWLPEQRSRTWQSRDTTYTTTYGPDGRLLLHRREFGTGPGGRTHRLDHLIYGSDGQLRSATYTYNRFERGHPVESGTVSFNQAAVAYLRAHPPATPPATSAARTELVARQAPGTYQPLGTGTYSKRGDLLTFNMFGAETRYERDPGGRATARTQGTSERLERTTYTYRPDGLLERETTTSASGLTTNTRYYTYRFY